MSLKSKIAVIQVYIYWMKGVEVTINPDIPRELPLLEKAYLIAQTWVNNNITSSKLI